MIDPTLDAARAVLEKWTPLANQQEPTTPYVPITVLTAEALDLAYFVQEHWEARTVDGQNVPGMKSGAQGGLFTEALSQELRELSVAISNVHSEFNAVTGASLQAPVERGEFLLSELKSALGFLFDDGIEDEKDAELERLSAAFSDTSSHDALAQSLDGFAYYAAKHRDELSELPEFEPSFIDEALVVARRLREQSAIKLSSEAVDRQGALLKLRNRLVTLLVERMRAGRRAARFVYRNHPSVARRAASSYERRRRQSRVRNETAKKPSNGQQPEAPANA